MKKKLKSIIVTLTALSLAGVPAVALAPIASAADIQGSLCSGTNFTISDAGGDASCNQGVSTDNFNSLLTKIINIFSAVVGVIAVVMIIVGGLRYITSGGDTSH